MNYSPISHCNYRRITPIFFWTLFFFKLNAFAQCDPSIIISGNGCIGSTLTASTNIYPSTVVWKRNGVVVTSQTITATNSGVTVAGGGVAGAAANQLRNPNRIFIDAAGNLYIPDMGNSRIQKWAPNAIAGTTVAGGNGTGSAANQFNRVTSVYVTSNGDVYATDQENGRIQKWTPGATTGITVASSLAYPTAVVFDTNGNMYVSEQNASRVTKWVPGATSGVVVAGGNGYGSAPNQLSTPTGIFVDANGNLYICDTDNNRVQKWGIGATSGVKVAGGSFGNAANQLANPLGIYVDVAGSIYITDYNNYRVQKWLPGATAGITVAGGSSGSGSNQFNQPAGISMDANCNLYVSDFFNNRVQKFSSTASATITATQPGDYTASITTTSGSTVVSNTITIQASVTPQITIDADTMVICPGQAISFLATASNTGQSPTFQWKKNGINAGTNSNTFTSSNLVNGDIITCVLSSTASCVTQQTVNSNSVTIQVLSPHKIVNAGPDLKVCEGTPVVLNAGGPYTNYLWQDGSGGTTFTAIEAGQYFVKVEDACGSSSDTVIVIFNINPKVFLPGNTVICKSELLTIAALNPYQNYLWSNGGVSSSIRVQSQGLYWLEVTDQNNCRGRDSILVTHKICNNNLYIPSAFTPNGDGKNDYFFPVFEGRLKKFKFIVCNRWGQVVFVSTDINKIWDGKESGQLQSNGVFVWTCSYQFTNEEEKFEKGIVTIIR